MKAFKIIQLGWSKIVCQSQLMRTIKHWTQYSCLRNTKGQFYELLLFCIYHPYTVDMYGHWTHCNLIETICHGDLKIKPGKTSIHSIGYVHKSLFFYRRIHWFGPYWTCSWNWLTRFNLIEIPMLYSIVYFVVRCESKKYGSRSKVISVHKNVWFFSRSLTSRLHSRLELMINFRFSDKNI